ncbi:MAG: hypothetical protein AB8B66_04460 [Rickettsiaceae bacterium]
MNDIRNRLLSTINNDIDGILDVYASSHKKMTLEEIQQEDPSVQNPTAKMNSHNDINSYKDTGRIVIDYETKDNIKAGINSNRVGSNAWGGIYEACIAAKACGVNINFHDERVNALGEKEWIATKFLGDKANLANSINIGTQFQGMKHIVYYSPINKKDNNKKISRSDNGFDKSTEEQAAAKSKTLNALKNQNDTPTLATKIAETIIENHGILKDKAIINSVEFADAIKSSDSLTVEDRKEFEPLFKQMQGKIYSKEELVSLVAKSKFVSKQVMATEQVEQIMLKNKQKQSSNYTPNHVISNARSR